MYTNKRKLIVHSNNKWVKEESTREYGKYLETNDNEQTAYHNLWDQERRYQEGKLQL